MSVEPLGSIMSSKFAALTPNPQGREHGNSRTDIAAIVGSWSHAARHVADCEVFSKHLASRTSRNTSTSREIPMVREAPMLQHKIGVGSMQHCSIHAWVLRRELSFTTRVLKSVWRTTRVQFAQASLLDLASRAARELNPLALRSGASPDVLFMDGFSFGS